MIVMKEIDFLPEWYKSGRRRQISYRTQYVALSCAFLVMVAWSFFTAHSVSKAEAELARGMVRPHEGPAGSGEFADIRHQVVELQEKLELIGRVDSRIEVASVLAEMSFLIDDQIVLSKVRLSADGFENEYAKTTTPSVMRVAGMKGVGKQAPLGDIRFKVVISGVASDASEVGELICKLEESPYFCQVVPSFSRNKLMQVGTGFRRENLQVSEFEISCYLANYRELGVEN